MGVVESVQQHFLKDHAARIRICLHFLLDVL